MVCSHTFNQTRSGRGWLLRAINYYINLCFIVDTLLFCSYQTHLLIIVSSCVGQYEACVISWPDSDCFWQLPATQVSLISFNFLSSPSLSIACIRLCFSCFVFLFWSYTNHFSGCGVATQSHPDPVSCFTR